MRALGVDDPRTSLMGRRAVVARRALAVTTCRHIRTA
jgi:hypothetical protein